MHPADDACVFKGLGFPVVEEWRGWNAGTNQNASAMINAGYVTTYAATDSNNFTFVTIKGAGHMVRLKMHGFLLIWSSRFGSVRPSPPKKKEKERRRGGVACVLSHTQILAICCFCFGFLPRRCLSSSQSQRCSFCSVFSRTSRSKTGTKLKILFLDDPERRFPRGWSFLFKRQTKTRRRGVGGIKEKKSKKGGGGRR